MSYPGKIVNDIYDFPILYKKDSRNNTRKWQIRIRIVKNKDKKSYKDNWDPTTIDQLPVYPKYISGDKLPPNSVAQGWITGGIVGGKTTVRAPFYGESKNIGKKNERNGIQTILILANNKYEKKLKEGYSLTGEVSNKEMYYPMLPSHYKDYKNIPTDAYIQPKIDGVHAMAYLNKKKEVIIYTRQHFESPEHLYQNIRRDLKPILEEHPGLYVDMELYKHGLSLQDISGASRKVKGKALELNAWIFDMFYPKHNEEFKKRLLLMKNIFKSGKVSKIELKKEKIIKQIEKDFAFDIKKGGDYPANVKKIMRSMPSNLSINLYKRGSLVLVPTKRIKNAMDNDYYYYGFLSNGFEGGVLKGGNLHYTVTKNKISSRSKDIQKRKPRYQAEYPIVDYTAGEKGIHRGSLIWILENEDGRRFKATPKGVSMEDKKKLYCKFKKSNLFNEEYAGKLLTVEYEDLSKDNIPMRLFAIGLRPYL